MKGKQQYCKCGNGLLIVKVLDEEDMIGLTCLECNKEFGIKTFQINKFKRIDYVSQEKIE